MNHHLADLYVQQGRLLERIAVQRAELKRQLLPVQRTAQRVDAALALLQRALRVLRNHPLSVAAALVGLVLLKPERAWAWGKRGLFLWRSWQRLRRWLPLRHWWR